MAESSTKTTSLEDWLRAELDRSLDDRGAVGGTFALGPDMWHRLYVNAIRRQVFWPRNCVECEETFHPTYPHEQRCPQWVAEHWAAG
jgi:hypothetical protein